MLLLTRADVSRLLDPGRCIAAVERALLALGRGECAAPGAIGHRTGDGGFHVKVASLRGGDGGRGGRRYFAAKVNGNFFGIAERGLPRSQGVIVLCDADDGSPLAVMDSIEITARRTAAASAVAARHLARADAATLTIAGCGVQGRAHAEAMSHVLAPRRILAYDSSPDVARDFARHVSAQLHVEVEPVESLHDAARRADIVVTCTPSREPILRLGDLRPGTFVAAVGADAEDKQEVDPALLAASAVVVDSLDQCAAFGDLHHAIAAGAMTPDAVRGDLASVVAGTVMGRRSDREVVVFDSTGIAIEDVASAALVYERALDTGAGSRVELGS